MTTGASTAAVRHCRVRMLDVDRQAHDELAALAFARAAGLDRSAVHLDQPLHQRQPMPSPPCDRSSERSTCVNISKMRGELVGGDADAGVRDRRPRASLRLPLDGQPDVPPGLRVLAAVVQQVAEHLGQPRRVGVQVDRLARQRRPASSCAASGRAAGVASTACWITDASSTRLLAQLDSIVGDAAQVEQVIDQPHQLPQLPLHRLDALAAPSRGPPDA